MIPYLNQNENPKIRKYTLGIVANLCERNGFAIYIINKGFLDIASSILSNVLYEDKIHELLCQVISNIVVENVECT